MTIKEQHDKIHKQQQLILSLMSTKNELKEDLSNSEKLSQMTTDWIKSEIWNCNNEIEKENEILIKEVDVFIELINQKEEK